MSGRRVGAQTRMEVRLLLRNGENLLVTLGIPAGLLIFFSRVDVFDLGEEAVGFLFPGMLAVGVMSAGMVSLAIATGFERSYLVLKRLGATPLRRRELVVAKVSAVVVIEALQVVVLTATAVALGWRGPVTAGRVALGLGAGVLGTAAFVGLGLAMAGRLRAVVTLALANALFVVLLLTSGLMFPLDELPGIVAGAAKASPAAALGVVLRHSLASTAGEIGTAFGVLAAWAVAAPVAAAALFRWEEDAG